MMNSAPQNPTVLAVNDTPEVLELLTVMLQREGYTVVTAEGGRRALELAHSIDPDVIISDVVMPEMDGLDFCRSLKQDARTRDVPVLLVSAVRTADEDTVHGLVAGADDYLEIPFRRQELLVKVARLTERHRVERHYREIVEQAADIIYTLDTQGHVTSINEAGARFFGRPVSELVGTHLSALFGADVAAEEIGETKETTSDAPRRSVYALKDAQGASRYLEAVQTLVRAAGGEPTGVRAVVRDITERHQVEEALRESEERYRQMFEKNQAIKLLIDPQSGEIVDANTAASEFYGYSLGELKTKRISDINTLPEKQIAREIAQAMEERRSYFVFRHRLASGEVREVEIHTSPVDVQGRKLLYSIIHDITERCRAEMELRSSEAEMRALFAAMTDVILVLNSQGRYLKIAPTSFELLYRPTDELIGKKLDEVFPKEQADYFLERIEEALAHQKPVSAEYSLEIGGSLVWFSATISPMLEDSVVWVARDITERKRAEQTLAQQAEREALINRISSAVHRSLDPTEVFRTSVEELGSHLGVDRCLLFMLDTDAGLVRAVAEYRAPGVRSASRDYPLPMVKDLIGGIRQHGILAFDDAATDERISHVYNQILRPAGIRSIMYVAIKVGDETPATFALSTTRDVRAWRETDFALARAIADQTGISIRQAELYQKAEATLAREALINRLSLAIRASLSLTEVLSTATSELGRALGVSRVHLRLYDATHPGSSVEHEYVAPHSSSIKHFSVSYDDPVGQRLLRTLKPIIIKDAANHADGSAEFNEHVRAHAARVGLRSSIDCPLVVNGRFRGSICIHQTDRVRYWLEDEVALVESVAAQLATGIAQAELFEITKRAKKEWETTFDAMSDGIFIFDKVGQLIRVNRAGAALEDTWPHLLLGRHCCDILRANNEDKACIVERAIAEGRSVTLEITPERYNRPLLVTVEPVVEGGRETVGAVCTARDLSDLRKVEAVARERQSLLTNILESVREPICAIDTRGSFLWCNSATRNAGGYEPEDLIGHHFLEIIYPADRAIAKEHFDNALKGEAQSYEVRYHTRDGELRYALFDIAPLVVEDTTTGVLSISRDITEQKQQRQRAAQADKLRALGQLASGVAHDFNNALAAILGRAQLMRRQMRDDALSRNLDIIQTAAEDAAATVRRIQTFARQSQAKEFERLDASSLLRDAIEITRTRWENEARMRGLDYEVELKAEPELYTLGTASELREVFVNLIVNAVDAMPYGGRLSISCERDKDHLCLHFRDTGTGMSEDVREKIFEPFYTTKGALGTGLGLAVSYGIVERHGGSISVESELGRGTTFLIELPLAEVAPTQTAPQLVHHETSSLSVLVIDDETFVRDTLGEMLEAMTHRVVAVGSGREALETLENGQQFDLVFTDLSMPEMDGWEVAREIRRRWPNVSIVLVTGYGKGTEPPTGEKNLIDGIIGKPFDFAQVSQTVAKVTGKHGAGIKG